MSKYLVASVAFAFGALVLPFLLVAVATRRALGVKLDGCMLCLSFFIAWSLYSLVVFLTGEPKLAVDNLVTLLAAVLCSLASVFGLKLMLRSKRPTPTNKPLTSGDSKKI